MNIQWYPGHMAKAKRLLQENMKMIDVVIEILDARIPRGSHNPDIDDIIQGKERIIVLNKSDLADPAITRQWTRWYEEHEMSVLPFVSTQRKGNKEIVSLIQQAVKEKVDRIRQTKGIIKTVRGMIVGIPNVGKSTFINQLAGNNRARTGDKPGVTRGKQWIKLGTYLELMDTPGLLWPKLEDPQTARHLAYVGSIKDEIMDTLELSCMLLEELKDIYPQELKERYKLAELTNGGYDILGEICKKRGWIMSGGVIDYERGSKTVIDEFRSQKIGNISLEKPEI